AALAARGVAVELATDARAVGYGGKFPARAVHVIPSATPRGPFGYAQAGAVLVLGVAQAYGLLGRLRPAAVVGFGGGLRTPARREWSASAGIPAPRPCWQRACAASPAPFTSKTASWAAPTGCSHRA